jgi:hypothetical protein
MDREFATRLSVRPQSAVVKLKGRRHFQGAGCKLAVHLVWYRLNSPRQVPLKSTFQTYQSLWQSRRGLRGGRL